MITNFKYLVTLSTLRESGENILSYSNGEYFTNFFFKNSTRKHGNYQGIQHENNLIGKIVLCNHYLSRKPQKIKCTFRIN